MISDDKVAHFDSFDRDKRQMTRLSIDLMLYFDTSISDYGEQFDTIFDAYYAMAGADLRFWYLTETMKKFKPATGRTLQIYRTWWRPGVEKKDLRELWLLSEDPGAKIGDFNAYIRAAEPSNIIFRENANYLRFVFPPAYPAPRIRSFAAQCAELLPFASGHGGYVIECNPYLAQKAQSTALSLAMRYQGVDIATMSQGPWAVRGDRIKGVCWLTLLGTRLLQKVGGLKQLEKSLHGDVECVATRNGAIFVICDEPRLGDVNRQDDLESYRQVYRVLEPAMEGLAEMFPPFDRAPGISDRDGTERWLERFSRG